MEEDYLVEDGQVERLHALLADALKRTRQDAFGAPVTVAEIYQDLVPYRHVRSILGFHMNADYEHTLLRMLAGVGDLARLEPETAREELRSELDTPNPNVGLFRKFAACDVWVEPSTITVPQEEIELESIGVAAAAKPAPARSEAGGVDPSDAEPAGMPDVRLEAEDAVEPDDVQGPIVELTAKQHDFDQWEDDVGELLLDEEVDDVAAVEPAAVTPDTGKQTAPSTPAAESGDQRAAAMFESNASPQSSVATASGNACDFCTKSLPTGRNIHYCPFCGADQTLKPCSSCREPLDPAWAFCIGCGNRQS